MADSELIQSILNATASMHLLSDELDRISMHSSDSRESSKFDSAFDSHYSEDTGSVNSQVLAFESVGTSVLPSIIPPPFPYRVSTPDKRDKSKQRRSERKKKVRASPSPSLALHSYSPVLSRSEHDSVPLARSISAMKTEMVIKPEIVRVPKPEVVPTPEVVPKPEVVPTSEVVPKPEVVPRLEVVPMVPKVVLIEKDSLPIINRPCVQQSEKDGIYDQTSPGLSQSDTSSPCVSNDSTPTPKRPLVQQELEEKHHISQQWPLTPQVTIIYPNDSDSDGVEYVQYSPRRSRFPKKGTLFYQDSLTPQPSPLIGTVHKYASPSHPFIPSRYRDASTLSSPIRQAPRRNPSILYRLRRKQGSFLKKKKLKKHFPVKRSFSDHVTYDIRKGWLDYEEDLDFISQPLQPRPVGRMIDKKEGRFHVVQLYKPPNGRYGIYISQRGTRRGVYVSRFADSIAQKFYTGLITPGDQIIRVNGINIKDQSVDDVYDLMTQSDSVIFTVIPATLNNYYN